MNCTAVELNDVTILRWRLPRRQDSAEHDECYISVSSGRGKIVVFLEVDYTAVELDDVVFRREEIAVERSVCRRWGGKVYCTKDRFCVS